MEETNIVEIWLRRDSVRWMAGALAGAFAGLVAMAFAMILAVAAGHELWFPIKVAALPILGNDATAVGLTLGSIVVGLAAHQLLCIFLGVVFAHFTGTNSLAPLLGVGLVWGIFGWIFINNLFSRSFPAIRAAELSVGAAFFVWIVYGLSLTSVSFFDRALRAKKA